MSTGYSATTSESVREAKARLNQFLRSVKTVPIAILESEAPKIENEAKSETPYKSGKLEQSVKVRVSRTRKTLNISASARDRGYNYAGIQHDNTSYNHPIKGKAHYLSDPFNRGTKRIIKRINRELRFK